jgi:integrase
MTLGDRTESATTPRVVTVGDHTVQLLRAHRTEVRRVDAAAPVFEKRGGGELNPESLSKTFVRLVELAGVTPITISGLRHTHAAMALKAGVNPLVVSKRLGHSTSAITYDLYRHLIPPLHDDRIEAFEAALFEHTQ